MDRPESRLAIDPVLLHKYGGAGDRRLERYPATDRFIEAFGETQLRQWLAKRNIGGFSLPLSVYLNLPFAGGKHDLRNGPMASAFKHLDKELRIVDGLFGGERSISRMRWGGGAMASSASAEAAETMRLFAARFEFDPQAEISLEVDAGSCGLGYMEFLATLGFNALSAECRDEIDARRVVKEARDAGFRLVTLGLVYGAPQQSLDSLSGALERVIALHPDQIQLARPAGTRPTERTLQSYCLAVGQIARAGYACIGIDRFARSGSSYAMQPESDVLAFGNSAIGRVGPTYYQNFQQPGEYRAALDEGRLPVQRGIELTADDLLRRSMIHALTTNFRVSIESIEIAHLIDFRSYFAEELADLRALESDGMVEIQPDWIVVAPPGRLLVHAIGQVFDKYLRASRRGAALSKVI